MLVGLATGDALGTSVEFMPRGSFKPVDTIRGGGPFSLKPGRWTDDTSMALCLADSLIEQEGFDAADQMDKYIDWYRNGYNSSDGGCFDIGLTTRNALMRYEETTEAYSGSDNPRTAGNGSIMRLAPVVIKYYENTNDLMKYAALSSKTTHAAPEALQSCMLLALYLKELIDCSDKTTITGPAFIQKAELLIPNIESNISRILHGSFMNKTENEIVSSAYCIATLEAALWALWHSENFSQCLLKAVNLGDDADTVGAVAGQLAGAFYGYESIPEEWRKLLFWEKEIVERADLLCVN